MEPIKHEVRNYFTVWYPKEFYPSSESITVHIDKNLNLKDDQLSNEYKKYSVTIIVKEV